VKPVKIGDIEGWLKEKNIKFEKAGQTIVIPFESTLVAIREFSWKEGLNIIEIIATVAVEVKPSLDLFRFLLERNAETPFGKFTFVEKGLDMKPTVFFTHSLLGAKLDKIEFEEALNTIISFADFYDEKIAELGQGKTFRDYSKEKTGGK